MRVSFHSAKSCRLLSSCSVITHCSSAFNQDERLKETPLPLVSTFYLEIFTAVNICNRNNGRSSALGSLQALGACATFPALYCFGAASLAAVFSCRLQKVGRRNNPGSFRADAGWVVVAVDNLSLEVSVL